MRTPFLLLFVVLPLAAAACGGHSPAAPPSSGTDSLTVISGLTGTLNLNPHGLPQLTANTDILVGDNDGFIAGQLLRGIVTFNIKAVPQHATISSATLQMAQCFVSGSPFPSLGSVVLDHIPPITSADDSAMYDTAAINPGFVTLSADPTLGLKTADITSVFAGDRAAGDTLIQLRLRFSGADGNNNGISDFAAFSPDSNLATVCAPFVTGHQPLLIVSFQ